MPTTLHSPDAIASPRMFMPHQRISAVVLLLACRLHFEDSRSYGCCREKLVRRCKAWLAPRCCAMRGKSSSSPAESTSRRAELSPSRRSKGRPIAGPAINTNGTVFRNQNGHERCSSKRPPLGFASYRFGRSPRVNLALSQTRCRLVPCWKRPKGHPAVDRQCQWRSTAQHPR